MTTQPDGNLEHFRDSLSTSIVNKLSQSDSKRAKKQRSRGRKVSNVKEADSVLPTTEAAADEDPADISDFIEYLAEEIYTSLPEELQTISYATLQDSPDTADTYILPLDPDLVNQITERLPPSIPDSLVSYSIIPDSSELNRFFTPVLESYVSAATSAPPEYTPALTASRPEGCEICGREQLQLTYHHLIPRQVWAKAVKRDWCKEWQLQKVCWLCRACHSYVHRVATNEELAKEYHDVELLLQREDIQKWATWVGRVRWKAR